MKERRLMVTPEFLVMMFSGVGPWKIVKNRLPEDARIVRADIRTLTSDDADVRDKQTINLWITSSAFRDDDPERLEDIRYEQVIG